MEMKQADNYPSISRGDVDYVVINRNGGHYLQQCLGALSTTSRLIVVDDASTDDSVEVIHRAAPHAIVIRHTLPRGPSAARLSGSQLIESPYAVFIDSDVVVKHLPIEELVEFFVHHPRCAAVGPAILTPSGTPMFWQASIGPNPWRETFLILTYLLAKDLNLRTIERKCQRAIAPWQDAHVRQVSWISGNVMCFRTLSLLQESFDPAFVFAYEEPDLCRRMKERNWEIWRNPDWQALHLGGTESASPEFRRINRQAGRQLYLERHLPVIGTIGDKLLGKRLSRLYQQSRILEG